MAYIGETPWHKLGTVMEPDADLDSWRIAAGLDWEIKSAPVEFKDEDGIIRTFDNRQILYRSDTKAALSVMSTSRYNVVQPSQIIGFYSDLVKESDWSIETAGSLLGGTKIWALARNNREIVIASDDIVLPYLLFATACDGSMATIVDPTTVRVVCQNTLRAAIGDEGELATFRIPHTEEIDYAKIHRELGLVESKYSAFEDLANKLAERKMSRSTALDIYLEIYGNADKEGNIKATPALDRKIGDLVALLDNGPGATLAGSRGTAWGLVNSVTHFEDYKARCISEDSRLNSSAFGNGRRRKEKAIALALAA
jgi:phage/plasmid-like protein (TIGR03299 family)